MIYKKEGWDLASAEFFLVKSGGASGKEPICWCRRHKRLRVRSLDWEDPLEEGMATHSRILAWRIPWTEKPGGLQSIGSQKVRRDWSDLAHTWQKEASQEQCPRHGLLVQPPQLTWAALWQPVPCEYGRWGQGFEQRFSSPYLRAPRAGLNHQGWFNNNHGTEALLSTHNWVHFPWRQKGWRLWRIV